MIETIKRIFSIPELRKKIFFTMLMLVVCRLGAFVPVPGINGDLAMAMFKKAMGGGQNLLQLMDMFSGGAFMRMKVIALGVMPYISASIILQLLMAMVPSLQREVKENPTEGKRKIGKWTRYGTVVLAMLQAGMYAKYMLGLNLQAPGIIVAPLLKSQVFGLPWMFYLTMMFTMTTGTLFLMWIGERISEKGIGNGVSLIITLGILSSFPSTIGAVIQQLNLSSQEAGQLSFSSLLALVGIFIIIIVGTILVIQGQRRIPIQYARRTVGTKQMQGGASYIPLKVNYAGVIPVIFASALLMFPATIGQFMGQGSWLGKITAYLNPGSWVYTILYVSLILFFTYFWTATQFQPEQIASDMKKNGAFIPGIRQGKATQNFLESTMGKITLIGGRFLALIAILPIMVSRLLHVDMRITQYFGGTSLLILVGVIIDTTKQIESHLLMKRYDGFMKRGRKQT